MNAAREAYGKDTIEGCLFHFLQAILAHMKNVIKFVKKICYDMMPVIIILTVLPPDEVPTKGIAYVLAKFDVAATPEKWAVFYRYFVATWLTYYNVLDWNVHRFIGIPRGADFNDAIVNKTQNPVECLNGIIGRKFTAENGHPTMERFIPVIKELSNDYVTRMRRIDDETQAKQDHPQVSHRPHIRTRT